MLRTRRARVLRLLLLVPSLALAGCVLQTDEVKVSADGSGGYTESVTLDMKAMNGITEQLDGMFGSKPADGAGMDGAKPAEREKMEDPLEKLKKQWKGVEGLEVTKATSEEKDGKVQIAIEAKFKTLEAYARATGFEMNAELKKNENGSFTLRFFSGRTQEGGGGDAEMAAAFVPMLEPHMKGLEMTRTLALPGKVVETNGKTAEDGSTVTWKVTWDDVKKGLDVPAQTVTFRGDGLTLKAFSIERRGIGHPGDEGAGAK